MTDGNSDGTFVEAPVSTGKPEGRVLYVLNPPLEGGMLRALSNGQISYLISPVSMRGGRFIAFRCC